jgi:hypothetical protein
MALSLNGQKVQIVAEEGPRIDLQLVDQDIVVEVQDRGAKGVPGTPGIPGIDGSGDKTFRYQQLAPSAIWTVNHNMDKYPSVYTFDSTGDERLGDILHIDSNALTITFSAPFGGEAYLN